MVGSLASTRVARPRRLAAPDGGLRGCNSSASLRARPGQRPSRNPHSSSTERDAGVALCGRTRGGTGECGSGVSTRAPPGLDSFRPCPVFGPRN